MITDKNNEVKQCFKKFCEATPDTDGKVNAQAKLKDVKQ
jgi:hypothetical protein